MKKVIKTLGTAVLCTCLTIGNPIIAQTENSTGTTTTTTSDDDGDDDGDNGKWGLAGLLGLLGLLGLKRRDDDHKVTTNVHK